MWQQVISQARGTCTFSADMLFKLGFTVISLRYYSKQTTQQNVNIILSNEKWLYTYCIDNYLLLVFMFVCTSLRLFIVCYILVFRNILTGSLKLLDKWVFNERSFVFHLVFQLVIKFRTSREPNLWHSSTNKEMRMGPTLRERLDCGVVFIEEGIDFPVYWLGTASTRQTTSAQFHPEISLHGSGPGRGEVKVESMAHKYPQYLIKSTLFDNVAFKLHGFEWPLAEDLMDSYLGGYTLLV